ncbi:MAG: transketolase C-terminal domain-containing protein [Nanoarchaeota archaeon]
MQVAVQLEKEGVANGVAVRVVDVFSLSHVNTDGFRSLIPAGVPLVTVHDAHHKILAREVAYSLAQIGQGNKIISFGMQEFGESGGLADLYKKHGMDVAAILKKVKEILI